VFSRFGAGGINALSNSSITGGCLCGALRYEAQGEPSFAGYCCCDDCQKASGSGFIPFMGFPASALTINGPTLTHIWKLGDGREAVRNSCAHCGSLVFGGTAGKDKVHTIYAGTLDDPSRFKPGVAINTRFKPAWVILPNDIPQFEGMPNR
jgi:hypothetical protein